MLRRGRSGLPLACSRRRRLWCSPRSSRRLPRRHRFWLPHRSRNRRQARSATVYSRRRSLPRRRWRRRPRWCLEGLDAATAASAIGGRFHFWSGLTSSSPLRPPRSISGIGISVKRTPRTSDRGIQHRPRARHKSQRSSHAADACRWLRSTIKRRADEGSRERDKCKSAQDCDAGPRAGRPGLERAPRWREGRGERRRAGVNGAEARHGQRQRRRTGSLQRCSGANTVRLEDLGVSQGKPATAVSLAP